MGQYRCRQTLEPGMILRAINGVPADRLAYNAILELVGEYGGDIRGLTLSFQREEKTTGNFDGFADQPALGSGGRDEEREAELAATIEDLRAQLDEQIKLVQTRERERDEQETVVIQTLAPLLPRAEAKHDYPEDPEDFQEGDLRFKQGDTLVLLDLSDPEWGRGYVERNEDDVGDFPRSFMGQLKLPESAGSVGEATNEDMEKMKKTNKKLTKLVKNLQAQLEDVDGGTATVVNGFVIFVSVVNNYCICPTQRGRAVGLHRWRRGGDAGDRQTRAQGEGLGSGVRCHGARRRGARLKAQGG